MPTETQHPTVLSVITPLQICEGLGITAKTLRLWIRKKRFPAPSFGSGRGRRWRASDIESFRQLQGGEV
jgi:excisionase family DNA binding protein